jgi:hypothetical protein
LVAPRPSRWFLPLKMMKKRLIWADDILWEKGVVFKRGKRKHWKQAILKIVSKQWKLFNRMMENSRDRLKTEKSFYFRFWYGWLYIHLLWANQNLNYKTVLFDIENQDKNIHVYTKTPKSVQNLPAVSFHAKTFDFFSR